MQYFLLFSFIFFRFCCKNLLLNKISNTFCYCSIWCSRRDCPCKQVRLSSPKMAQTKMLKTCTLACFIYAFCPLRVRIPYYFYCSKNKKSNTFCIAQFGVPGGIRTPNRLVRSQELCPVALREQKNNIL